MEIIIDKKIALDDLARIFELCGKVPRFMEAKGQIEKIEPMEGGLTNTNYKVYFDGDTYAVRLADPQSSEILNREAECHNASQMAKLGINVSVYYYDPISGNQVCDYLDECKTLSVPDFKENFYLKGAAEIFRKVHSSDVRFQHVFDLVQEIEMYKNVLKRGKTNFYADMTEADEVLNRIEEIYEKYPPELVPCHNDPLAENFICSSKGLFLIDWEYAGMGDPMFDIGDFIVEMGMETEQENEFLHAYFQRDCTRHEYARINFNKFFCDFLWSMWAIIQINVGKPYQEYWDYGKERWDRVEKLIHTKSFQDSLRVFDEKKD